MHEDMLYQSFRRAFHGNRRAFHGKITWVSKPRGRTGFIPITGRANKTRLIAKIDLTNLNGDGSIPTSGKYMGYQCSVINPAIGTIDSILFPFNDYLSAERRIDKRPDFKERNPFRVNRNMEWYIAVPNHDDIDRFVERMYEYFKIFKQ